MITAKPEYKTLVDYYYPRAKLLQEKCNWGDMSYNDSYIDEFVNDELMQNVTIYDCIHRRAAGFSNVIEDLWYLEDTPKWDKLDSEQQALINMSHNSAKWDTHTWMWVMLFHRMTGSGASFKDDHGYRNSAVQYFGVFNNIDEMKKQVQTMVDNGESLFTSIGNQPAAPKKGVSNLEFLFDEAPALLTSLLQFMSVAGEAVSIKDVVNYLNVHNSLNGHRKFNFQYTAFAADLADYFPDLVDPTSHMYLGSNARKCAELLFEKTGKGSKEQFYDAVIDRICEDTGGLPKDVEDVMCDFVRFANNYNPYDTEYKNNSGLVPGWEQ